MRCGRCHGEGWYWRAERPSLEVLVGVGVEAAPPAFRRVREECGCRTALRDELREHWYEELISCLMMGSPSQDTALAEARLVEYGGLDGD